MQSEYWNNDRSNNIKENFTPVNKIKSLYGPSSSLQKYTSSRPMTTLLEAPSGRVEGISVASNQKNINMAEEISIDPPTEGSVDANQKLAGFRGNPKTLISPIVAPLSHDLDYWKDNNLIVHSAINSRGVQEDMYLSGYAESTCCDYLPSGTEYSPPVGRSKIGFIGGPFEQRREMEEGGREGYCPAYNRNDQRPIVSPVPSEPRVFVPTMPVKNVQENYVQENYVKEKYCPAYNRNDQRPIVSPVPSEPRVFVPTIPVKENYTPQSRETRERFNTTIPLSDVPNGSPVFVTENEPGWVNTASGYNPEQLFSANLPTNLPAGKCQQNPRLAQFNKNLFTQTVTPGVYTTSQITENPISNLGISFQQQFEPTTCVRNENGLFYTQHDPRIIQPSLEQEGYVDEDQPKYDTVYDPRFSGYGTSYRSYIDPVTGQPRFYYDDVDSIRMPNYITRSKIDTFSFADTYGPAKEGEEFGNDNTPYIRALAQDKWLRDSLEFRNDLSERRMRKVNAEAWQRRSAPIYTQQIVRRPGRG